MHEKLGEARTCGSEDMIADRQTHRQTDRQTDTLITILRSPIGGGVTNKETVMKTAPALVVVEMKSVVS